MINLMMIWKNSRDYYREHGYLDVDIPQDNVIFAYPTPEKLVLTINISEGRQYRIGDIAFKGNKLFTSALLKRVARRKKSGGLSPPNSIKTSNG